MKTWIVILLVAGLTECFFIRARAQAQMNDTDVLVLDFIGFADTGKDHAQTFQETVLPDANLLSIGIHGFIPDAWRTGAGYDAIIRAWSAEDYDHSASEVYGLIKRDQTILAFDFNEHGLPRQLRPTNKIFHPAMVAARVAQRWLQEHPNGVLILRGHSDGTYAESYIFKYLKKKGMLPDVVILESPRQAYGDWAKRAKAAPKTLFLSITSTDDLPREWIIDRGYANVPSDNWVNLHVQGLRGPLSAHSVVTEYRSAELKVQRTEASGRAFLDQVSLGNLVQKEISDFLSHKKPGSLDPSVVRRDLPPKDERKKMFPLDPWDKGGGGGRAGGGISQGAGGRTFPSAPGPDPRGGISADIQINPQDFKSK